MGATADLIGLGPAAFLLSGTGILAAVVLVVFVRETLVSPQRIVKAHSPVNSV